MDIDYKKDSVIDSLTSCVAYIFSSSNNKISHFKPKLSPQFQQSELTNPPYVLQIFQLQCYIPNFQNNIRKQPQN